MEVEDGMDEDKDEAEEMGEGEEVSGVRMLSRADVASPRAKNDERSVQTQGRMNRDRKKDAIRCGMCWKDVPNPDNFSGGLWKYTAVVPSMTIHNPTKLVPSTVARVCTAPPLPTVEPT